MAPADVQGRLRRARRGFVLGRGGQVDCNDAKAASPKDQESSLTTPAALKGQVHHAIFESEAGWRGQAACAANHSIERESPKNAHVLRPPDCGSVVVDWM